MNDVKTGVLKNMDMPAPSPAPIPTFCYIGLKTLYESMKRFPCAATQSRLFGYAEGLWELTKQQAFPVSINDWESIMDFFYKE